MRRRTIGLIAVGLLLAALLLAGAAAYTLTAQPRQSNRILQIPLGAYGQLWISAIPCTARAGGSVAVVFQRPLNTGRAHLFPDAGTATLLSQEAEHSFTPLVTLPTAPACR